MIYHRQWIARRRALFHLARDIFGLIALFTSKNGDLIKMFGGILFIYADLAVFCRCAIEFDLKGQQIAKSVCSSNDVFHCAAFFLVNEKPFKWVAWAPFGDLNSLRDFLVAHPFQYHPPDQCQSSLAFPLRLIVSTSFNAPDNYFFMSRRLRQ